MKKLTGPMLILLAVTFGCADATGVQRTGFPTGGVTTNEYPDSGEYDPALVSVDVDAIAWFTGPGQPRGAAQTLAANANHATQSLSLQVYVDGQTVVNTPASVTGYTQNLPQTKTWSDTIAPSVTYACGASATAYANSEAEIRLWVNAGWTAFGQQNAADEGNGYMNPCPPPPDNCYLSRLVGPVSGSIYATYEECQGGEAPSPPTGGMGENGIEVCYTVWREYWLLDLETGFWEFLYEEPLGYICFLNGHMT